MANHVHVLNSSIGQHDTVIQHEVGLLSAGAFELLSEGGEILWMDDCPYLVAVRRTVTLGIEPINSEHLFGPVSALVAIDVPGPAARVGQLLRLGKKSLALLALF